MSKSSTPHQRPLSAAKKSVASSSRSETNSSLLENINFNNNNNQHLLSEQQQESTATTTSKKTVPTTTTTTTTTTTKKKPQPYYQKQQNVPQNHSILPAHHRATLNGYHCAESSKDMNQQLKQSLHHAGSALSFLAPRLSSFQGGDDDEEEEFISPSRNQQHQQQHPENFRSATSMSFYSAGTTNEESSLPSPIPQQQQKIRKSAMTPQPKGGEDSSFFSTNPLENNTNNNISGSGINAVKKGRKDSIVEDSQQRFSTFTIATDDSTWERLSALPKHVSDRVKPVWRHRAGISSLKPGEDISLLRPFDRLRVLRNDPYLRRDFRKRVAQEDRERRAVFNAKMTERLDRQRESDISVACAAVARQTDKLAHDEDEGRGPGFSSISNRTGGGSKVGAPSGRIIRQYFEYATREMQMWRRAQRLSTVEERGKQLQHSRDLRFEEELMQTEKALETRAGETELEMRQNFFATIVVIAMQMIEWHGRVLQVLNPKTRSVRSIAIRLAIQAKIGAASAAVSSSAHHQHHQQKPSSGGDHQQQQQEEEVKDRFTQWSRSLVIPANACMFTRTTLKKNNAARLIFHAWLEHRDNYFEVKRTKSANIIRHFMKDMGKMLSFTVATRRFKKIVKFVQHHWRGRESGREARKDLLAIQLEREGQKEIEQARLDIDSFTQTIKQQEKEVAGRRGLQRLTGAEAAHKIIHDMTLRVTETTEYIQRLEKFLADEIEQVAWQWVIRQCVEYDHKLVRFVHAFSRYRAQVGIPHGCYTFVNEQSISSGVPKPTRPFFRRLLPNEDIVHIIHSHCGYAGEKGSVAENEKKPGAAELQSAASGAFVTQQSSPIF